MVSKTTYVHNNNKNNNEQLIKKDNNKKNEEAKMSSGSPHISAKVTRAVRKAVKRVTKDSNFFPSEITFQQWNKDDLIIGGTLGTGGFCEVRSVKLKQDGGKAKPLAMKSLKLEAMLREHSYQAGAGDLATEAYFLGTLNHRNIVKLHGITAGDIETNISTGEEDFFILVDQLKGTMERRIEEWQLAFQRLGSRGGLFYKRSAEYKTKRHDLLLSRLQVAMELADALCYLHSNNIVYRDLKPENVGFDAEGVLKMFDFGMAKELKEASRVDNNGTYKMTGKTGSRRYMAPEVAQSKPYGLGVDVYSFGILLWEMCALEKPFYGMMENEYQEQVSIGGRRPAMTTQWWPVLLQYLIKKCWSSDPQERPTMEQVRTTLREIIEEDETNSLSSACDTRQKTKNRFFRKRQSPAAKTSSSPEKPSSLTEINEALGGNKLQIAQ